MMKILHWRGADIVLIATTIIMMISILWLIIKMLLVKKQKA